MSRPSERGWPKTSLTMACQQKKVCFLANSDLIQVRIARFQFDLEKIVGRSQDSRREAVLGRVRLLLFH